MAEFPALPIFTDALLGDTVHLTTRQFGAYMLLLIVAWRTADCSLPDNDVFLARCTRLDRRAWAVEKSVVMSFWKQGADAKWRQGRLLDERKFAEDRSARQSKIAKGRWLKTNETADATVLPRQYQNDAPTPTPLPSPNLSSLNGDKGKGELKKYVGIEGVLDDDDLEKLRIRSRGWDKHFLFRTYDAHSAKHAEPPRDRKAAFFGWLSKYTGNKPPK